MWRPASKQTISGSQVCLVNIAWELWADTSEFLKWSAGFWIGLDCHVITEEQRIYLNLETNCGIVYKLTNERTFWTQCWTGIIDTS